MKNFTKLFLAVAAALFAYACVTDTTNDLGVKLDGQVTEITISLEESRTQLGAEADGIYPLYWSEGDAISVNGTASAALSAAQAGSAAATFVVDGTPATPYCIAYPAAPAGKVLFAENQNHVSNTTFGSGVSTMYAYGDSNGVQLSHLTGVLKIGVVGSATITKAQISTANRTPIAGAFDFDFEKGVATATAESKSVINYLIPTTADSEGLELSNEPQYLHVVVPAGVYEELYVTLFDTNGGVMYATVKADDTKPLLAGKVRSFTNVINYAPSNVTIIKDKESLKAWAAESATSTDVIMVADVDMTGEPWTSVVEFAGAFRGNGYAIKGLTAPLFGNANARAITGVHLVDVNIEATNHTNLAALAGYLKNPEVVVRDCSASGNIKLIYDGSITTTPYLAGLVSRSDSTIEVKNLFNNVNIEATGKYAVICIGGVIGYMEKCPLTNCTNLGSITFTGEATGVLYIGGVARLANVMTNCVNGSKDDETGETAKIVINGINHGGAVVVGGVLECAKAPEKSTYENCHNYANIYYHTPSAQAYVQLCGMVRNTSNNSVYWRNCSNHGDMTVTGGSDVSFICGGFETRHFNNQIFYDCQNYGDITVTAEASAPMVSLGGFLGTNDDTGEGVTLYNFTNYGDIKMYSDAASKVYLGGFNGKVECGQFLVGSADDPTSLSHNYGDILYEANNDAATVYAGGVAGFLTNNLTNGNTGAANTSVRIASFVNHGNITINGSCGTVNIGGLVGRSAKGTASGVTGSKFNQTLYDSCNKGNLTINADVKSSDCAIGGMYGFFISGFTGAGGNWVNEGKLTFAGNVSNARLLVGGFIGATDKAFSGETITVYNFGDIECTGTINTSKANRIGGLLGQTNTSFANFHSHCNIKAIGYQNYEIIGMLTGSPRGTKVIATNCSAGGSICYESENSYNADGDLIGTTDKPIVITQENFFDYLYGKKVDWTGIENYDGCTFLPEKPTL